MNLRLMSTAFLRWLANYGLSLSAADYALPEERESGCPFAQRVRTQPKKLA